MEKNLNIVKYAILFISFAFALTLAQFAMANELTKKVETIEIPVLVEKVRAGEVITEEMLTTKEIQIRRLNKNIITEPYEIIGMEAKRSLRPNMPVFTTHVKEVPVVRKGELVKVMYLKPGLKLSIDAEAMQNGNVGDMVKIINKKSKTVLYAKVQSNGTVLVN